jgi:hypothetical protein
MAQTKVDYPALEREYLESEETPSLRKMAEREGISNSTLSDYARKHKWAEKRAEIKDRETRQYLALVAERNARRLARMSELTVDVLEGHLIRFAQQLTQHLDEDGKPSGKEPLFVSPKDVQEAIRLIRDLSAQNKPQEAGSSGSASPVTINIGSDFIAAVGELARGSLQSGRAERARPIALPGGAARDPERRAAGEGA